MLSAGQIEEYVNQGFLVLDSELSDFQIEAIQSEILDSLAEIESRKADDPAYQEISRYRRFMVGLHVKNQAIRRYVRLYRKPRSDLSDAEKKLGIEILRD